MDKDVEIKKSFPSKLEIVIALKSLMLFITADIDERWFYFKVKGSSKRFTVDKTNDKLDSLEVLILCNEMLDKTGSISKN